ncbi:MAG: cold shock domain-containing protein [Phaeodactylibacter sp.]|nr:cold shock domain-containing protein [Phaeodactylibacter sp.]MCB9304152.1 cold shock domain-containing protein [Lewinellaceae bacterium]
MSLKKIFSFFTAGRSSENTGQVKFFNRKKGYGFIQPENMEKEVFVHASNLESTIQKGDKVSFELKTSPKGLEARNVRVVEA